MTDTSSQELIRVDDPVEGVRRVTLARPHVRNAQSPELLYALDDALAGACADESVRVIIVAADGPDFSSGHDLAAPFRLPRPGVATVPSNLDDGGLAGHYAFECEAYLGLCQRWRDLPKPTIAQVQGRVIAGGLMLVWPLDIVIAAESATFSDPVTAFGVNGVEYFAHVWELGHRKAREILFTGRAFSATEAERSGMVNHVVPQDQLERFTLDIASQIAARPAFALRTAKESVNASLDAQGHRAAIQHAFLLHTVGHGANLATFGSIIDPNGAAAIRKRS